MAAQIAYINSGAQTASEASSASVALPKGIQIGDLLLMWVVGRPIGTAGSNDTISVNNSWAQYGSRVRNELGTSDLSGELWYKVADSTEVGASPSAPTVTVGSNFQGTTAGWTGQILCVANVEGSIWDATGVTSSAAAATTWQPTGITTATSNAVVLSFVGSADDNALNFNTANGYTIAYSGADYDTASGADMAAAAAFQVFSSSGAKTCPTWNESVNGTDGWVGMTVALAPVSSVSYDLQETWMKTDGSTWGPGMSWTTDLNTGATCTTQTGAGHLSCGTVASYGGYGHAVYDDSGAADGDYASISFRFLVQSTAEHYNRFWFRDNGGSGNALYLEILPGAGSVREVTKVVSYSETALGDISGTAIAVGDVVHFEISVVGSAIKAKTWLNNEAKPGTWNLVDVTDSDITAVGNLTFSNLGGSASANTAERYLDFKVTRSGATNATATPSTVAAVAAVPSVTVQAGSVVSPAAVAAVAAVPSVTVQAGATASPAAVAAVVDVPSVSVLTDSVVALTAVAAVADVPAPSVLTDSAVVLAAVAGVVDVPAVTVLTGVVVAPSSVDAVVAVPAPSVVVDDTVAPSVVAAVADVPALTVIAGGDASVSAVEVAAVAAVGAPTVSASADVVLAAVAGVAAVPAPSVTVSTDVVLSAVDAVVAVGAPTFVASSTVTLVAVTVVASIPAVTVLAIVPAPVEVEVTVEQVLDVVVTVERVLDVVVTIEGGS